MTSRVIHYIKTPVSVFLSGSLRKRLWPFQVDYGRGDGYRWIVRIARSQVCRTLGDLRDAQAEILKNLDELAHSPAPWEIESLFYMTRGGRAQFSLRRTFRQSRTNGPVKIRFE